MSGRPTALALLLVVALPACVSAPPIMGDRPGREDSEAEARYQSLLAEHTRRAERYNGLQTRAFFAATRLSRELREAKLRREATFRSWSADELARRLAQDANEAAGKERFVVGLHSPLPRYDDLESDAWNLALRSSGREIAPSEVRWLGRGDVALRAYYPYLGDFWVAYEVSFPLEEASSGEQVLELSSEIARVELTFGGP